MRWIDDYVVGIKEASGSSNPKDILDYLSIKVIRVLHSSTILQKKDSIYIRDLNGTEIIFIRDDLKEEVENFILAHEIGHAILHIDISAAYHSRYDNKGKYERQADYFAAKLLGIKLDTTEMQDWTTEQISTFTGVKEEVIEYLIEKL